MKRHPAIRVCLPGGAVLSRPAGAPDQPLTCSRCGGRSGPANVDTLTEIAAWAERHRGPVCQPTATEASP